MPRHKTIMNTRQASTLLGVHMETIRRLARKGAIPAFKVGKDWRFDRRALLKWVENGSASNQKPKVLVVDDDRAICKQIRRLLEPIGWQVHACQKGGDGLAVVHAHPLHLILLDLAMPGMTGPEFLGELRKLDQEIPVIIITGYPHSHLMVEAMSYGPILLMAKPIDKHRLLSSVGVVLKTPVQSEALIS